MPTLNPDANRDDQQLNSETGEPVGIAPDGAKTEGEIDNKKTVNEDEALRIDPNSRIPRPVQPDLA
ncbi:MAG: hypothetical protein JWM58_3047 [Rhizobium sp.]|nr:hypothetical protein [Rhizobium sp.]